MIGDDVGTSDDAEDHRDGVEALADKGESLDGLENH